jgi:protocatechuate 3,4-dioxygenase alpha subunit
MSMSEHTTTGTRRPATPGQTVGPFFHYALPYERGPELVPPGTTGAVRLHGTVVDGAGNPVPDALLEIRQADTDAAGRFSFTTVEPAPCEPGSAAFFSVVVFARGLPNRLFTRAYLPGTDVATDPLLASLPADRQATLLARRDDDRSLRYDVHLQGERETVFLTFPGHGAG